MQALQREQPQHAQLEYTELEAKVLATIMCQFNERMDISSIQHGEQFLTTYSLKKGIQKFGERGRESALKEIKQMHDIIYKKLASRGIDTACLEQGKIEERGMRAYQTITVREGVDKELARKIVKMIKDTKMKVQAAIQGEQVRVSGKKRDDLQSVIEMLKSSDIDLPLQYTNFRD